MFWLSSKIKLEGFFLDEKHLIVDIDLEGMKESFSALGIGSNSPLMSRFHFPGASPDLNE